MVLGIKVELKYGREVKGSLKNQRVYEDKYLPLKTASHIIFPIRKRVKSLEDDEGEVITKEFEINDFDLRKNKRTRSFRRELQKIIPKDLYDEVSRAYEQVGDIGIITIFPEVEKYEKDIARALLETNKGVRLVVKKQRRHDGDDRIQKHAKIAGEGKSETNLIENGAKIYVDINKMYFSSRTANERKRIASLINDGEDVLVLFAGCAPYPLVIAKNTLANEIHSIEQNHDAHLYAQKNVDMNKFNNIKLHEGDVREIIPTLNKKFDRIIMPHPTEADYFFKDALQVAKDNAFVHLYLFSKETRVEDYINKLRNIAKKEGFIIKKITTHTQQKISEGVYKYCFDMKMKKVQ